MSGRSVVMHSRSPLGSGDWSTCKELIIVIPLLNWHESGWLEKARRLM